MEKTGRNDPCPCGSGKKYKKCCLSKDQVSRAIQPTVGNPFSPVRNPKKQKQIFSGPTFGTNINLSEEPLYDSLEEIINSIREEGYVPYLETVDEDSEFGTTYQFVLLCKHAWPYEWRTYELKDNGKFEWIETGEDLPCEDCEYGKSSDLVTEDEIINAYRK